MGISLNNLLEKKPDFYELTQREQIKYIAFVYTKNSNTPFFNQTDVRELFEEFNLVIPSHLSIEFKNLCRGKVPIFVKKVNSFVFHPNTEKELTLELFSTSNRPTSNIKNNIQNTELFNKYDLHPQIKKVSFQQFQGGFYKEAIQNALVEVIDQVKQKTGNPKRSDGKDLDGDDLMNKVFGCDNSQVPMIKFNYLYDGLDKAEQRGMMYLFKGVVGIRDKKAHLNFVQNDPLKTIEYLSFASLLLRLLDDV